MGYTIEHGYRRVRYVNKLRNSKAATEILSVAIFVFLAESSRSKMPEIDIRITDNGVIF